MNLENTIVEPTKITIFLEEYDYPLCYARESYYYDIIKKAIDEKQKDIELERFECFNNPNFEVNMNNGQIYYKHNAFKARLNKKVVRNLIDYYGTPIFDEIISIVEKLPTSFNNVEDTRKKTYYIRAFNEWTCALFETENGKDLIKFLNNKYVGGLNSDRIMFSDLSLDDLEFFYEAPFIDLTCGGLQRSTIQKFLEVKEDFWKLKNDLFEFWGKDSVDKIKKIPEAVKTNSLVLEKFQNFIMKNYEVENNLMLHISKHCTDLQWLLGLILTGHMKQAISVTATAQIN